MDGGEKEGSKGINRRILMRGQDVKEKRWLRKRRRN